MHDDDTDIARLRVFSPPHQAATVEKRLDDLVEFIAELDGRLTEVENLLTKLATGDVRPEDGTS
jgi:hypothetical protein